MGFHFLLLMNVNSCCRKHRHIIHYSVHFFCYFLGSMNHHRFTEVTLYFWGKIHILYVISIVVNVGDAYKIIESRKSFCASSKYYVSVFWKKYCNLCSSNFEKRMNIKNDLFYVGRKIWKCGISCVIYVFRMSEGHRCSVFP